MCKCLWDVRSKAAEDIIIPLETLNSHKPIYNYLALKKSAFAKKNTQESQMYFQMTR